MSATIMDVTHRTEIRTVRNRYPSEDLDLGMLRDFLDAARDLSDCALVNVRVVDSSVVIEAKDKILDACQDNRSAVAVSS